VLDGDPAPHGKGHCSPTLFGPCDRVTVTQ